MFRQVIDFRKKINLTIKKDGAGTRDRTEDTSLEGWGFTTKLCPHLD